MDPAVQRFGDLVVDLAAEPDQTAERRLDVAAGAAETIVKIEVAEGGVEVVAPHQADHAAAKPDAFRIAGGAVDRLGRFDEFVRLALALSSVMMSVFSGSPLWAAAAAMPRRSAVETASPRNATCR